MDDRPVDVPRSMSRCAAGGFIRATMPDTRSWGEPPVCSPGCTVSSQPRCSSPGRSRLHRPPGLPVGCAVPDELNIRLNPTERP